MISWQKKVGFVYQKDRIQEKNVQKFAKVVEQGAKKKEEAPKRRNAVQNTTFPIFELNDFIQKNRSKLMKGEDNEDNND